MSSRLPRVFSAEESSSERNKIMFNNALLSDVKFVVRNGSEEECLTIIHAHKYVLAVSNPVFFAMFCGELAETRDTIELSDCDSEGFLELLRYLYCDEAKLNGNNVMQVLYLAKKFMVPSLVLKCTKFLEQNLDAVNVFAVLPQAILFDESPLIAQCWDIVDAEINEAITSKLFEEIDQELFSKVLERDSLSASEIDLFRAADRWATSECERRGLVATGNEKRKVLGPVLQLIRFPLMTKSEFIDVVLSTEILNLLDVTELLMFFNSPCVPRALKFSQRSRYNTSKTLQCERMGRYGDLWSYERGHTDAICVTVNTPVILKGFRLFGQQDSVYSAAMKLYNGSGTVVWSREQIYAAEPVGTCGYSGYDVILENRTVLQADIAYTLEATINGPNSLQGTEGRSNVTSNGISFTFTPSSTSNNGTGVYYGQFPVLLFRKTSTQPEFSHAT